MDLMTLKEVASYLRVNKKTIHRLLEEGDIPAFKVGHQWRFRRSAIDEWLWKRSVRKGTILVIDDEATILKLFKETLERLGYDVITAKDGLEGLELVKRTNIDMAFIDLKMPGMDGAQVFGQIKATKPNLPIIIITGYPDSDLMARALAQGPFGIMKKPFTQSDIIAAVNSFSRTGQLSQEANLSSITNQKGSGL